MHDQFHIEVHGHVELTDTEKRHLRRFIRDMSDKVAKHIESNIVPVSIRQKVRIKITQ